MIARSLALALLLGLLAPAVNAGEPAALEPGTHTLDTVATFQLRTRWGQRVIGAFPDTDVVLEAMPDGRQRVRVALATGALVIADSTRYTRLARGPRFFDSERHPHATFVSAPFEPALLERGGPLPGTLTLLGESRPAAFEVEATGCDTPGRACDVVAHGTVERDDYGLDGLPMLLGNRVHLTLRVRHADGS
ncbi:YceI family protein [Cognatilysobacter bugurensis]|uniref:YceI family protein n=1 Tax=Cognatilysobacter bugurensis TaxID=543356 RepID=UPI00167B3728|nr:YceI family protein [Lysobacter bugurensis]